MNNKFVLWLYEELPKLTSEGILTDENAENLRNYYGKPETTSTKKTLLTVFGILGSILIGAGIILVLAANWDFYTRSLKTVFSFLPLLIGQSFLVFTFFKRKNSIAWKEGASTFLFLAIGATIALIGQVYNIEPDTSGFLLSWMILGLPLIFIMDASIPAMMYVIGITSWGQITQSDPIKVILFWILWSLVTVHLYKHFKKSGWNVRTVFISLALILSSIPQYMMQAEGLMFGKYWIIAGSLIFVFYLLLGVKMSKNFFTNPFGLVGFIGTVIFSYILTSKFAWSNFNSYYSDIYNPETLWGMKAAVIYALSLSMLFMICLWGVRFARARNIFFITIAAHPLLTICMFSLVGKYKSYWHALITFNIFILIIGILLILEGIKNLEFVKTNAGLLVLSILIIIRFFDQDISFMARGLGFIILGAGLLFTNIWLVKRKEVAHQ